MRIDHCLMRRIEPTEADERSVMWPVRRLVSTAKPPSCGETELAGTLHTAERQGSRSRSSIHWTPNRMRNRKTKVPRHPIWDTHQGRLRIRLDAAIHRGLGFKGRRRRRYIEDARKPAGKFREPSVLLCKAAVVPGYPLDRTRILYTTLHEGLAPDMSLTEDEEAELLVEVAIVMLYREEFTRDPTPSTPGGSLRSDPFKGSVMPTSPRPPRPVGPRPVPPPITKSARKASTDDIDRTLDDEMGQEAQTLTVHVPRLLRESSPQAIKLYDKPDLGFPSSPTGPPRRVTARTSTLPELDAKVYPRTATLAASRWVQLCLPPATASNALETMSPSLTDGYGSTPSNSPYILTPLENGSGMFAASQGMPSKPTSNPSPRWYASISKGTALSTIAAYSQDDVTSTRQTCMAVLRGLEVDVVVESAETIGILRCRSHFSSSRRSSLMTSQAALIGRRHQELERSIHSVPHDFRDV